MGEPVIAVDALERQRLTWELGLLNEIAAIVASSLDLEVILQRAAERIADGFQAEFVFVRLKPADGGDPRVVACVGSAREELEAGFAEVRGVWVSDRSIQERRIVRLDDVAGQPFTFTNVYRKYRWQSILSVPIAVTGQVLGAITVASLVRARFAAADEQFLQAIGRQFAMAVANGQLYERVHRAKVEWERTFDAISDPIAVFDAAGRTMRVNAALARLRHWNITETQGRTCAEVGLCGGQCPECVVGIASRESRPIDHEITTADGRIFAVTTLPITGRSGTVVQFGKEVTEQRRRAEQLRGLTQELRTTNTELLATLDRLRATQAQLLQSEKLSAIGLLVAGVAHELNNPLTSIIGYAQLVHEALADQPVPGDVVDDMSRILSEADRAAKIVRNLLTFARRQSSERVRHDVAELCMRVVDLRAYDCRLKSIQLLTQFDPDLPPVFVDGGQIQQALLNLVLNAEQALKDATDRRLEIIAHPEPESATVLVQVRDTGHGIHATNLRRIFDPFFTTRPVGEGTGLGLSIAYGIVRDHGGQIWAESVAGQETSFFIRLPSRLEEATIESFGTVLVAHADSVNRDFLAAVFSAWGFPVRSAPNTREAIESLAEDDIGLAVLDRSIIDPAPDRWQDAWQRRRRPAGLIAVAAAQSDLPPVLQADGPVVLVAPYDVPQIWRAVQASKGARS